MKASENLAWTLLKGKSIKDLCSVLGITYIDSDNNRIAPTNLTMEEQKEVRDVIQREVQQYKEQEEKEHEAEELGRELEEQIFDVNSQIELDCITQSKMKLYEHQKNVIRALQKNRGIIMVHSVGAGKILFIFIRLLDF